MILFHIFKKKILIATRHQYMRFIQDGWESPRYSKNVEKRPGLLYIII